MSDSQSLTTDAAELLSGISRCHDPRGNAYSLRPYLLVSATIND